jgi:hypothetical protein
MDVTDLKVFAEEDGTTRWVQDDFELIKISESMARMLFSEGWTIYFFEGEKLSSASWWSYIQDRNGIEKYHQLNDYPEYFIKESAIKKSSEIDIIEE